VLQQRTSEAQGRIRKRDAAPPGKGACDSWSFDLAVAICGAGFRNDRMKGFVQVLRPVERKRMDLELDSRIENPSQGVSRNHFRRSRWEGVEKLSPLTGSWKVPDNGQPEVLHIQWENLEAGVQINNAK